MKVMMLRQYRVMLPNTVQNLDNGIAELLIRRGFCRAYGGGNDNTDKVMTAPPVHRAMRRKAGAR